MVKGIGCQVRKTFKMWGVLFTCLGSKAVAMWLAAGYDTKSFMIVFQKQSSIYGRPHLVISDMGTQLLAAGKEVGVWKELGAEIQQTGTVWKHIPTASQWRNSAAECAIAMAKNILKQTVDKNELLSHVELEAAVIKVAEILNNRLVAARFYSENEFHPVTPADLLLGRMSGYKNRMVENWGEGEDLISIPERLEKIEQFVQIWWQRWSNISFHLLGVRQKWKSSKRNLMRDEIVLLKNEKKLGKDNFRLARVIEVEEDEEGHVRSVLIGHRNRRKRRSDEAGSPLETVRTAVKRLVVIQAAEKLGMEIFFSEASWWGTVNEKKCIWVVL